MCKEFTLFKLIFMHRFGTFPMPFQDWQGFTRVLFQCQSEQWKVNQKILLELLDGH